MPGDAPPPTCFPGSRHLLGSLKSFYFTLCVRLFCLKACKCSICAPGTHRAQKASDPPELRLQKVGSHWELNLGALRAARALQRQVSCGELPLPRGRNRNIKHALPEILCPFT